MTALAPEAAYRLWSATYDATPNPVLALEHRVLSERLALRPGTRVLDLATGTGRWLEYARGRGAHAIGIDLSAEMLAQAAAKGSSGRLIQANLSALPLPDASADVAICSFAIGYLATPERAFREMARVARTVIVSDLHPAAVKAGWVRGFRAGVEQYTVTGHSHSRAVLYRCAKKAGLRPAWQREAAFGEPERAIFEQAGRAAAYDAARQIPAILISCWTHP